MADRRGRIREQSLADHQIISHHANGVQTQLDGGGTHFVRQLLNVGGHHRGRNSGKGQVSLVAQVAESADGMSVGHASSRVADLSSEELPQTIHSFRTCIVNQGRHGWNWLQLDAASELTCWNRLRNVRVVYGSPCHTFSDSKRTLRYTHQNETLIRLTTISAGQKTLSGVTTGTRKNTLCR